MYNLVWYNVEAIDGVKGLEGLIDGTVKLIYGSPPYPNAHRNYGSWPSKQWFDFIYPFIEVSTRKLSEDGFIVINVKANRDPHGSTSNTTRSLIVEKLAIKMEEELGLYCVDIEIWSKKNPIPGGLRVACQDAYEQMLWFAKSPNWKINLDAIRRPYASTSLNSYARQTYRPRKNGLKYVRNDKHIDPNEKGALPKNVIDLATSNKTNGHQATQRNELPRRYILACTSPGDLVVDPWLGSGTTGIEAVSNDRNFMGFDVISEYVEQSRQSIQEVIDAESFQD